MKPKDKIDFYNELATKLKANTSDRMKKIFTEYGFSFAHINPTISKHEFAIQVLEGLSREDVVSLANDFDVDVPKGFTEQNKNIPKTMPVIKVQPSDGTKKIFISHASNDREIVRKLIDYIRAIGVNTKSIFCSSLEPYGIPLGEDFLSRIKSELNGDALVLFVLSPNFYESAVCLCEMGAAWVNTKEHIPILIPPLEFEDVKGVIPTTQGMKINDKPRLSNLKKRIEQFFNLEPVDSILWEEDRDKTFLAIEGILSEIDTSEYKQRQNYKAILKQLSTEDLKVLKAIQECDGESLNLTQLMNHTKHGDALVRNLERLGLIELAGDYEERHDLNYYLTFFGIHFLSDHNQKITSNN
ncbi:hypothetical protein Dfri01_55770 [Dyadobacter frigoris]|uniref:toll/interleukin-1 receptor domain-containing protein n=1 Tax=Dyadobacter frigoris TaxID=2576211 RepID=UPI0024A58694|nr:toll/interleukin-1 receptor domain-containing protein [Dyadobacter frigoris]GLU56116.1 hypothetical protein Dfri01_55770 [Dyadobacter frigoris]